jgi:hypothetical protein
MTHFEELVVSSSSQWRICLTLRLNMDADCLTSLLRRRTTALTPATVSTKFVKPMPPLRTRFTPMNKGSLSARNMIFYKKKFLHKHNDFVFLPSVQPDFVFLLLRSLFFLVEYFITAI